MKRPKVLSNSAALRMGIRIALLVAAMAAALPAAAALSSVTCRPDRELVTMQGKEATARGTGPLNVWFNSALRPIGVPIDRAVTICITQQVILVRHGQVTDAIEVPDAVVQFKPWESQSSSYFFNEQWNTSVPSSQAMRDAFMCGVVEPFPSGLPRDTSSMTWTARFESDTPGVAVQWNWGAAGYTQFSDSYDALRIEAGQRGHRDAAGTPLDFKTFAFSDEKDEARFIGSRSATARVVADFTGRCGGLY